MSALPNIPNVTAITAVLMLNLASGQFKLPTNGTAMFFATAILNDEARLFLINPSEQFATAVRGYSSMRKLISDVVSQRQNWRELALDEKPVSFSALTWLAPVPDAGKLLCVGRNYREHADEMGAEVGEVPVIFGKFNSALIGHGQAIVLPRISQSVDYEAELVVVIGKGGRNISIDDALAHVFGYTCGNDVSARDWQKGKPGGQWLLGKSFDTFAPVGPWIATAEAVPDHRDLEIGLRLNGVEMQRANTRELIFDIPFLVSHLSKFMTLSPGDLIFTGTPPGVGAARIPPVFLQADNVVEVEINGIGVLRNSVRTAC